MGFPLHRLHQTGGGTRKDAQATHSPDLQRDNLGAMALPS
jgi:hypothetical protein